MIRHCIRMLGACAAATFLASGFGPVSAGAQELRVLATGEPYSNAMKAAAAVYEAETGIKVVVDQFPYGEAYNKAVLVGSSSSDEYDILVLDCIWLPIFVKNAWVQPFEPLEAKAERKVDWAGFVPGTVEAYDIYDGQHFAAPIDFFIEVLAYRTDKFAEAGLTEPPKTWDEFRAYAEALNDPANDFYGVITMPGEQDAGYSEWTVRLAGMELPPDANQFVWNTSFEPVIGFQEQGAKALQLWLDIQPFTPPGSNEMGYAESTNAFMQGRGAMFLNWYMIFSDVENPAASAVAGKVAYALPPRSPGQGPKHEYLGGFQISISSVAQEPAAAYDFIAFLTSDRGQELMLENGAPGAYRSYVYDDAKWLERLPFLKPVKQAEKLIPLTSDFAEYVEMQRLIYDRLFASWVGDETPAEAMAAAERDLAELFKELGYRE